MTASRKVYPAEEIKIEQLFRDGGLSVRQIGESVGRGAPTVRLVLKRLGYDPKNCAYRRTSNRTAKPEKIPGALSAMDRALMMRW